MHLFIARFTEKEKEKIINTLTKSHTYCTSLYHIVVNVSVQLENLSHSQSKNEYTSQEKILSLVDLNDIKVNANVVEGVSLKCLYFYAYLNAHALICSSKPTTPKVCVVNEAERILISLLLKPLP